MNHPDAIQDRYAAVVRALKPEATLAVIAPAGAGTLDVKHAMRWVSERGYNLHIYPGVHEKQGYLAGSDAVRLRDLHAAFADPAISAILCLRGGYGTPRLLDQVDFDLLREHPKPFIGYSDITALHAAIARYAGFVTFHGPLLNADLLANKQPPTEASLLRLLRGQVGAGDDLPHPVAYPLTTLEHGVCRGRLTGGNLSMICATLGTPWEIDTDGCVLLLEDVNEPLYRVDRLLTQLRLAGKLEGLRGVLVGDFAGLTVEQMAPLLRDIFAPLRIPVLAGWRSGHCDPNLTLPLGAMVKLDAGEQRLTLEQDVVR